MNISEDLSISTMCHPMLKAHVFLSRPTWFVDSLGHAFALRGDVPKWMNKVHDNGRSFLDELRTECLQYISACGPRSIKDINDNHRGDHWYSITGVDRQMTAVRAWRHDTLFHLIIYVHRLQSSPCSITNTWNRMHGSSE